MWQESWTAEWGRASHVNSQLLSVHSCNLQCHICLMTRFLVQCDRSLCCWIFCLILHPQNWCKKSVKILWNPFTKKSLLCYVIHANYDPIKISEFSFFLGLVQILCNLVRRPCHMFTTSAILNGYFPVTRITMSNNKGEKSSQKLGRDASHRVRSVWKSLGQVSLGSKKFGPKIFSLILRRRRK